jgi:hypothetical protein
VGLVAALLLVGGVVALRSGGFGGTAGPGWTPAETVIVEGTATPPKGVDPASLAIVGLGEEGTIDTQGNFTAKAYEDGVSVVGAMAEGGAFGLMTVAVTRDGAAEDLRLDAQTTAESLVFTTPFLQTNDPDEATALLSVIKADPKVRAFAAVIESVFDQTDPMGDPAYQRALAAAVESVLTTLNP